MTATAVSSVTNDEFVVATSCPKCGQDFGQEAAACARCGLVIANWKPEMADAVPKLDDKAASLWLAVVDGWEDNATHDVFVKYCSLAGLLGPAGRQYRERLVETPEDKIASEMQKKVLAMASALLGPLPQKPQSSFINSKAFWAIVVLFALGGMSAGFLYMR